MITERTIGWGQKRRSRQRRLFVGAATLLMMTGALGPARTNAGATNLGPVNVLYAGSFLDLMQRQLIPAFQRATGYSVSGVSNGSSALASEIDGGTQVGDDFISASPSADATLHQAANGDWVTLYDTFATSRLVLGYNPASTFAKALTSKPWYEVVDQKGFLLGRTDPATDPKGVLAVTALTQIATTLHLPALGALARSSSNVFAETALIGELQSGQLDAGFFYAVEAAAAHLKTVALSGTNLSASYTVAVLKNAPHKKGAEAFVRFLLSPTGRRILRANGVTPIVPAKVVTLPSSPGSTNTTAKG